MGTTETFLPSERTATAIAALGDRLADIEHAELPAPVRERAPVLLTDLLGVTLAGMRTPELRRLVDAWPMPAGRHPLLGTDHRTTPDCAALLAAVAACSQELDEGNKHAVGHPAAHVVFAAVAAAQQADHPVPGRRFLAAVAAGYEVAARFGRALTRAPDWHTHGHWGVTGAACAAAMVGGGDPRQVAAAIDASTGLMTVAPWDTVLAGDFTRNLWMGQANLAGLSAAHLARAGLVANRGGAFSALGLLGRLDPESLTRDLGSRWLSAEGYLKRHAACSYTHAAIDIVQTLRAHGDWGADDVSSVWVGTHSLAAPLLRRDPTTRLSAMFSLPFAVGAAMVNEAVDPAAMEPGTPAFARALAFSDRVEAEVVEELDAYLPDRRVTELRVVLADGRTLALAQPDPVGDTSHFPLTEADVVEKIDRLLGNRAGDRPAAADLLHAVRGLEHADDVVAALAELPCT